MKICIPSKNRERAAMTTLDLLTEIPKEDKLLFIEPQDLDLYSNLKDEVTLVLLDKNDRGLSYSRNFQIKHCFQEHSYDKIITLDDNMQEFCIMENNKAKKLPNSEIPELFERLEGISNRTETALLTLGFRPSVWYAESDFKYNTRVWAFFLFDRERLGNLNFDPNILLFEDYDMVANIITSGRKTGTYYKYAFYKKMGKSKGGDQFVKNHAISKMMCGYLQKKWGKDNIRVFYNKKHGIFEPQFLWSKLERV